MNGFALIDAIVALRLYANSAAVSQRDKQLPLDRHTVITPRQEILVYIPPVDVYTKLRNRYIRTIPGYWQRVAVLDYQWAVSPASQCGAQA